MSVIYDKYGTIYCALKFQINHTKHSISFNYNNILRLKLLAFIFGVIHTQNAKCISKQVTKKIPLMSD